MNFFSENSSIGLLVLDDVLMDSFSSQEMTSQPEDCRIEVVAVQSGDDKLEEVTSQPEGD